MQASVMRIDEFISDKRTLVIPVYQRDYKWRKTDCETLFNDVEFIAKNGGEHFIGTFVYQHNPTAGIFQEYVIIDGQQRITSIILFAKALYDSTDNIGLKELIHEKFIKHRNGTLKGKCKLRPTEYDCKLFEKLMTDDTFCENNFTTEEKNAALYGNYKSFREKISASERTPQELHDAIYQLKIVSILLQEENPQEIFESLNSTGRALAKSDLIRNFLLMPLTYDEQQELYKDYWLQIQELLRTPENVEDFLVQYLIAKLKTNDAYAMKVSSNNLYVLFKKFFADKCSDSETCLKDMLIYAKYFRRLLFSDDTKFENLSALDKKFYELTFLLKANNSPIILMYLLDRNERESFDESTFIIFVKALISLTFRAKVCKSSGITPQFAGNVLARLDKENFLDANKFWRALFDSSKVVFQSDKDFQMALINNDLYSNTLKSDGCKYLLYSLERQARAKELPSYSEATVEHILPQKLNPEWNKYLKERNDSQTHELWLHTLGNLTLTGENEKLGNDIFDKKKETYECSNFFYTRSLIKYSEWTSKQIQTRAQKLADVAIKIWILPEEFNSHLVNRGDTFNLDSDFGQFTKIKPATLFISNTEIPISAWKHLLCEVIKQLYDLDSDIFRRVMNVKKNLFVTESKNSADFEIDENLYMKTQKNVEQCLRITKTIIESFDRLAGTNFKEEISFTLRK